MRWLGSLGPARTTFPAIPMRSGFWRTFVDVVVHVFEPNARAHYDLESMWPVAPHVDVPPFCSAQEWGSGVSELSRVHVELNERGYDILVGPGAPWADSEHARIDAPERRSACDSRGRYWCSGGDLSMD